MNTGNVIPRSATSRPLRLRKRPDLIISPQWNRGRKYWVVKDPVSLAFFHLRDEEYEVLNRLDGHASLNDLRDHYERRFAPQRISVEGLRAFVAMLHRSGLVVSETVGQGGQLLERRNKNRRRAIRMAAANVLAIRFRGIDPEPLLRRLSPLTRVLFSPLSVLVWCALAISATILITVQFDVLQSRLPGFQEFFTGRNVLWLLGTLAVTKILHEFGHALACRNFGGECHEIGLMLLVFTPCLYCNVTDSWRFPSKWHRIAVAAAGMYVELFLAAVCTFLWWFSYPGTFNTLCLNVIFVCSVSTVLFNGNPLLRYDGYYILADLIEVPNLWQRSRAVVYHTLAKWCLGLDLMRQESDNSNRPLLATYAIASMAYRTFVMVLILWFVYQWLAAHRLEFAGQLFVTIVVAGMLATPCMMVARMMRDPGRRRMIHRRRLMLSLAVVTAAGIALLMIPFPHSVKSPAAARLEGSRPVHVSVTGTIVSAIEPGVSVHRGEIVATLFNRDMELEFKRLQGERDEQRKRIENLETLRVVNPEAAAILPAARQKLKRLENQLRQQRSDMRPLILRAPIDGTVIPPQRRTGDAEPNRRLPAWTGTPLDSENRGSLLKRGSLFCLIGNPNRHEVVALVDESQVDLVGIGQRVSIVFDQHSGQVVSGKVMHVAPASRSTTLNSLVFSEDRELANREARNHTQKTTTYTVRIRLIDAPQGLRLGSQGTAKIHTSPRSLGWRCLRYLRRTFRFDVPRTGV